MKFIYSTYCLITREEKQPLVLIGKKKKQALELRICIFSLIIICCPSTALFHAYYSLLSGLIGDK